ncbi:MAP kinase [Paraphysoderma sedebokerense]|nr:MAP kinase [Paraphysoderma sedebokerense]
MSSQQSPYPSPKTPKTRMMNPSRNSDSSPGSPFQNLAKFVDPSGRLNFSNKAVLHSSGVDFSQGQSYSISLPELELREELGRGQYGVVQKVFHKPTKVVMAMKEIRLELDSKKLNQILMELDILHRGCNHFIVEFYGAFFIESTVYYCMEYMDAGSLDKLYGYEGGIKEDVLSKITSSVVQGLKFLKDELSIIHRDVKPTNILCNTKGEIKLCDFGVSGQLIQSLAKTNVGCQSYMAPERINAAEASTYTTASDVWSLGLSLLEMALATYPYPPDKYDSIFAQLNAIVMGPPPQLPADKFSTDCNEFVNKCLQKDPADRPTYSQLLDHPYLLKYRDVNVDVQSWVVNALNWRNSLSSTGSVSGGSSVGGSEKGSPGGASSSDVEMAL